MANSNIPSIGRFSSQMLTYLGTQRTVKDIAGSSENTFKYNTDVASFIEAGTALLSSLGEQVVGSMSTEAYNFTLAYFESRGASKVYAETMTSLVADISTTFGITPQLLLEESEVFSKLSFTQSTLSLFNQLRDPSHQVGVIRITENIDSLRAREIRY